MWNKDIKIFLNTIREKGQQAFTTSFYFRSNIEPNVLFEKTILKMAKQSKHKGTVVIKVKPCQYLDNTLEILCFSIYLTVMLLAFKIIFTKHWQRRRAAFTSIPQEISLDGVGPALQRLRDGPQLCQEYTLAE